MKHLNNIKNKGMNIRMKGAQKENTDMTTRQQMITHSHDDNEQDYIDVAE